MITSVSNERIKELAKLNTAKYRKETKRFIVEGEHLVLEAKNQGVLLETYTIKEDLDGQLVSENVMKKLCNTNSVVNQIGICKMLEKSGISEKVLILDQLQDPGNVGTLMRTAVAFNFKTIFIADNSVDIYNDKVIRSSQGAIFKLNFIFGDKKEFINKLQKTHIVYSTDVSNGKYVEDLSEVDNVALILGSEGNGVSDEIKDLNLTNLNIKLENTESLNVGIAGAILMYELNKKAIK